MSARVRHAYVGEALTHTPSENRPGLKLLSNTNRDTIGVMISTYEAVTASVKTAPIAPGPNRARSPTSSASAQSNQTVLTGVPVYGLILQSSFESGRVPSLVNANADREEPIMYLRARVKTVRIRARGMRSLTGRG